ncbi:MAG: hypothetical protein LLG01_07725 [Planctomycetaceae bacterium]|nr:hypothetical protein [Planctomycetaceae bacterium]
MNRLAAILYAAAVVAVAAPGCNPKPIQTSSTPCYLRSPASLYSVHRVAMVTLDSGESPPAQARQMTDSLAKALLGRRLFQLVVVAADDPSVAAMGLDWRKPIPLEQMQQLRQILQCDAIVMGTLANCRPYPHMQMGLKLRLIDLRGGLLVWGIDNIWDGQDESTAKRMERYYKNRKADAVEPLDWRVMLVSPSAFGEFVADDVASTLPNRGGR